MAKVEMQCLMSFVYQCIGYCVCTSAMKSLNGSVLCSERHQLLPCACHLHGVFIVRPSIRLLRVSPVRLSVRPSVRLSIPYGLPVWKQKSVENLTLV